MGDIPEQDVSSICEPGEYDLRCFPFWSAELVQGRVNRLYRFEVRVDDLFHVRGQVDVKKPSSLVPVHNERP